MSPHLTLNELLIKTYRETPCGEASPDQVRRAVRTLLAFSLERPESYLYAYSDHPLTSNEQARFHALLERYLCGEPLAYIVQESIFFGFPFMVNRHVLIPRPETEILVSQALSEIKQRLPTKKRALRILDIGTGTGAIAISLALHTNSDVIAWDLCPEALKVAAHNAKRLGARVAFEQVDVTSKGVWKSEHSFDLIVSNPPYVSGPEMEELPHSVKDFEPDRALFGGPDGLLFYRIFSEKLPSILEEDGLFLAEIGSKQAAPISRIYRENKWTEIVVIKDYSDLDRVFQASRLSIALQCSSKSATRIDLGPIV